MNNNVKKPSQTFNPQENRNTRWCSWVPNTSGSISFYTVGRSKYPAPVLTHSEKIPYKEGDHSEPNKVLSHYFTPGQCPHLFKFIHSRLTQDDIETLSHQNGKLVFSCVHQARDNYDGYIPIPIILSQTWYRKLQRLLTRRLYLRKGKKIVRGIPYFLFYYGTYLSPPQKKGHKPYKGVQHIKGKIIALISPNNHANEKIIEKRLDTIDGINSLYTELEEALKKSKETIIDKTKPVDAHLYAADFELARNGI